MKNWKERVQEARHEAHRVFDRHTWDGNRALRSTAYSWLAKHMDMASDQCHIRKFDIKQCLEVMDVCRRNKFRKPKQSKQHTQARGRQSTPRYGRRRA